MATDVRQLVTLTACMGDDLMVVNAARVSFAKHKAEFDEADAKLISYLARNNHWTPFAHPQIQFRFKMPIFVANQWKRHQVGLAINEVSRRYVDFEPEFFEPEAFRSRVEKVKQGSGDAVGERTNLEALDRLGYIHYLAAQQYQELLSLNVCPEQARIVLPQSMMTEFVQTGSLYAFARICKQRLDAHAQYEIRQYAQVVADIIQPLFPVSWLALMLPNESDGLPAARAYIQTLTAQNKRLEDYNRAASLRDEAYRREIASLKQELAQYKPVEEVERD